MSAVIKIKVEMKDKTYTTRFEISNLVDLQEVLDYVKHLGMSLLKTLE